MSLVRGAVEEWSRGGVVFVSISGNAPYDMYNRNTQGSSPIDCTNNWWGTADETEIEGKIYDWSDDASLGVVDYIPYLTAPQ